MPRDGSGIFTKPFPDVVAGTTVESAVHNGIVADFTTDANAPRPIIAGGTGAANAKTARNNLDAEVASVVVTNYDSHVWESGSFYSAPGATGAPNPTEWFVGNSVWVTESSNDVVLRAYSVATGLGYLRIKSGGSWGAWTNEQTASDTRYVNITGDSMGGHLHINANDAALYLEAGAGGNGPQIIATKDVGTVWQMCLGRTAAAHFELFKYVSDTPTSALLINYSTLAATFGGHITAPSASLTGSFSCAGITGTTGNFSGHITGTTAGLTGNFSCAAITATTGNFSGNVSVADAQFFLGDIGAYRALNFQTGWGLLHEEATGTLHYFGPGSVMKMRSWYNGDFQIGGSNAAKVGAGQWSDSSDARIKDVVGPYEHGLAEIMQVEPVRYTYKGNSVAGRAGGTVPTKDARPDHADAAGQEFVGVVAQEIEIPLPETVTQVPGLINGQPVEDLRILDPSALTYALINAVKELAARVEALEAGQPP